MSTVIEEDTPTTRDPDTGRRLISGRYRVPWDDPRWPARCTCGELFTEDDQWQCPEQDWYQASDGRRFCWGIGAWDGPPGAMIRASWRDEEGRPPAWMVFLPSGTHWCTNDRASGPGNQIGSYWEVTGDAPLITVTPSIDDRGTRPWHGWIRDGHLINA